MDKKLELCLIAACGLRGELGFEGQLPWHQPSDLKFFSKMTKGFPIIMGRKTFESFPNPLPGRIHCILSSKNHENNTLKNIFYFHDIQEIISWLSKQGHSKAFIIGGESLYLQTLKMCSKIYITHIHGVFKADVFFDLSQLKDLSITETLTVSSDEKNKYGMTFITYSCSDE